MVPLAALGIALGQALSGAPIGGVIGSALVGAFTVALHIAFWVTLVFAILERSPGKSALERNALTKDGPWSPWTVDQLPEPRPSGLGEWPTWSCRWCSSAPRRSRCCGTS